jgi:hypothetical protein
MSAPPPARANSSASGSPPMIVAIRRWRGVSTRFQYCDAARSILPMPAARISAKQARPKAGSAGRHPHRSGHRQECLRARPAHKRESDPDERQDRRFSALRSNGREWVAARAHWPSGSMSHRLLRVRRPDVPPVQAERIGWSPWKPNSREGLETGTIRSGFRSECRKAQDGQLGRDRCWARSGRKPIRPPSDVIVGWKRREHGRKGATPSGQRAWVEDLAINLGDQREGTDETPPSWLDERRTQGH